MVAGVHVLSDIFTVNLADLWADTYLKGRRWSNKVKLRGLGSSHLATASLYNEGEIRAEETPSYRYFTGEGYDKFTGNPVDGHVFAETYLKHFREYYNSFKSQGYRTDLSVINVEQDGDRYLMSDGNRRLAILMALGYDEIAVRLDRGEHWRGMACNLLDSILQSSHLVSEGRRVPYQPILGLDEYTTPKHLEGFRGMLGTLLASTSSVRGKRVLDVGSCLGYYSYALVTRGALVTGVERTPAYTLLCSYVSRLNGYEWSNPCFVNVPVEAYAEASTKRYDYVLMFNVFHHLVREYGADAYKTLKRILGYTDAVYLSMEHRGIADTQTQIKGLLIGNTGCSSCEDLGTSMFGRNLYRLEM